MGDGFLSLSTHCIPYTQAHTPFAFPAVLGLSGAASNSNHGPASPVAAATPGGGSRQPCGYELLYSAPAHTCRRLAPRSWQPPGACAKNKAAQVLWPVAAVSSPGSSGRPPPVLPLALRLHDGAAALPTLGAGCEAPAAAFTAACTASGRHSGGCRCSLQRRPGLAARPGGPAERQHDGVLQGASPAARAPRCRWVSQR